MMIHWGYWGAGSGLGLGLLGPLFWIFLFAALIWLVLRALDGRHGDGDEAMAILRARFARGEMSKEDFEVAVATLRGHK